VDTKNRVLNEIDSRRDEIVEFLQALIRVPSVVVSGNEKECQSIVSEKLREMGVKVDVWEHDWDELKKHPAYVPVDTWMPGYKGLKDRPNVVGVFEGKESEKTLVLNGHIDVVTPGPINRWKYGPFDAVQSGSRIYGRGAADMKGGVTAMVMALDCILKTGIEPSGKVILESVVDEETGGNGTLACLLRGYTGDAGIFTEPTATEIHLAQLGAQFFRITIPGRMSHLAFRTEGVNAIEKGFKIFKSVRDWEQSRKRLASTHPLYRRYIGEGYPFPPCEIGIIKGGDFSPNPAEECILEGGFQTMPSESIPLVRRQFKNYVQKRFSKDKWLRAHPPKIDFIGLWYEGAEIARTSAITRVLVQSFREATGRGPVISAFPTGCDMRLNTNHGGTPSLVFGPGDIRQAHFTNEYIEIKQVVEATKVISLLILNWFAIKET